MKILNSYLEELRHHLPAKNRDDIIAEIRSVLMDMIEERNPHPGSEPDEDLIKAVLLEYGPPRKVAQQYNSQQRLIGSHIFPVYLQVLKIVLVVVAALNVLGVIVAIVSGSAGDSGFFVTILETLGGMMSSLFTAFGIVTLSFILIERTTPQQWRVEIDEDWSPDDLAEVEDKKRIKITELAVEITLGIIFIVLINVYLDRIGIYYLGDAGWVSAPILNENVLRYIPWITAYTVLDIGLNLYLIRKGFWDMSASIGKILTNVFKIAVMFAIIVGPAIITIDPAAWEALSFDLSLTAQRLSGQMNTVLDVLLGLGIFGLVVDSIKRLVPFLFKKTPAGIKLSTD
ncbi:MAG: hypothetical protein K0B06_02690 [Brevefilum sp.]|nr:hypothetical protein [Brevefilum sp.]